MAVKLKAFTVLIALILCVSLISGALALYSTDGSLDITFSGEVTTPTKRTVYYYDVNSWHTSGNVYAYAWGSATSYNSAYPGVEMTAVTGYSGWYSVEIDNQYTSVVFNSNNDSKKTADLTINENNLYYNGSSWADSIDRITIYYCNIQKWSNVYAYVWKNGGSNEKTFPGSEMTPVNGYSNMLYYTISLNYDRVIFSNGNGTDNKTEDLSIDMNNYCYDSTNWTTLERVYFKNNNSWENIKAHHWSSTNTNLSTVWSGDSMFEVAPNWYSVYVPNTHNMIIFNNGNDQTGNLEINYSQPYYSNGWVSSIS